jgi:hypothetical protein
LEAIERALADPSPRKLHGTKGNPGIFLASSAVAKAAAQRCLDLGLLAPCGEQRTKSKVTPLYGIAPAGVQYLLEHDPLQRLLAATQDGVTRLAQTSVDCQQTLARMQQQVTKLQEAVHNAASRLQPPDIEKMLAAVSVARDAAATGPAAGSRAGSPASSAGTNAELDAALLQYLQQHKRQAPLRPLDLPQLFRLAQSRQPALSLGSFHDVVRRLADARQLRLSPFTQAMYQLPEPQYAMIVGREIMYYVESV